MPVLYDVNVTVHVLAAMLWVGGMFFLGVVGAPLLRAVEPIEVRQRLFQTIGERFRTVGWWSITVLVFTGIVNLHYRGWLRWDGVFGSMAFWESRPGRTLAAKLAAVVIMIVIAAVHDFVDGPRAGRARPGSEDARALRRRAAILARVNAIVGVFLVAVAVRLARGG